ncbi:hypothetical protein PsorP6_005209 [Peronosclerospora sorghi]|uniref:Uncharacterized protein n=1 Tax=Peronosclerospora sorghi TaxID=230839 RepID=A0ACC0W567_9STRA|nr:hypothetical protein PsorP6_005209 [Peronosclerospora sorghi]
MPTPAIELPAIQQPAMETPTSTKKAPSLTHSGSIHKKMLSAVNKQRVSVGLRPLFMNAKLQSAAQGHSNDMARNNFMGHGGTDGSTMSQRISRAGYEWSSVRENVAAGRTRIRTTLSIAYAIEHPEQVTELVLREIFHLRKEEINFYYQQGANVIYPDRWEAYSDAIPEDERDNFLLAYHKRLTSDDPTIRIPAAVAWTTWEKTTSNLIPPRNAADKATDDEKFAEAFDFIENHYSKGFFPHDEFLNNNVDKIRHIPTVIVQGRYVA